MKAKENKLQNLSDDIIQKKRNLFIWLIVIFSLLFVFTPFYLFREKDIYRFAINNADVSETNLSFMKRDVFFNEESMNKYKDENTKELYLAAKEEKEVLIVKEYSSVYEVLRLTNYVLIKDPTLTRLNVEYYYAKNLNVNKSSFPIATFLDVAYKTSKIINFAVLLPLKIISYGALITVFSLKYKKYNNEKNSRQLHNKLSSLD